MHARPEVKRVLIKKRMRKWLMIARCYPDRDPSQARRNFLRLLARYPEIGLELGLTIVSAYE
jgi:hypothetical protein